MRVEDVSFVVVAKDEALSIRRCLDAIMALDLVHCELICVDSGSADETASIMRAYTARYADGQFISLPACRNVAEARNAGKGRATRRWVFLVDGDIELYPPFLQTALAELSAEAADAVTGGLDEQLHGDVSGMPIGEPYVRRGFAERAELMSCGGIFMAARKTLEAVGDYDERFDRSQDIDFSLRLSSIARLAGLPISMGCHHTREYRMRPWQHVKNGYVLCQGMLARKHYHRKGFWREWLRSRKSYVAGLFLTAALLAGGIMVIGGILDWRIFLGAVTLTLLIEAGYSAAKDQSLSATLVLHLVSPLMIVVGFVREPYTRGAIGGGASEPGSRHFSR